MPKGNKAFEALGFPGNLAYGHRAALRRECMRFLTLSYLVDFMAIQSLRDIYLGTIREMIKILDNFNKLSNAIAQSGDDINNSFKNLNQITSELAEADIKNVIDNLNNLLVKLQDPDGTIGKLMTTDSLHNSVNTLVNNIDSLIQKISNNPKKYLKISVF